MTGIQQRRLRVVLRRAVEAALPPQVLILGPVVLTRLQEGLAVALGAFVLGVPARILLAIRRRERQVICTANLTAQLRRGPVASEEFLQPQDTKCALRDDRVDA